MTPEERRTAALTAIFLLSLAAVVRLGDPLAWVGWGVAMVALSGAALVAFNR